MKTSSKGRFRPKLYFTQTPHSITRRARLLPSRVADLLGLICERTVGFGQGSVELTYRKIGEILKWSLRSVARAARLLLKSGDVEVERKLDGSYRWFILLEPEDIREDPEGVYRLRETSSADDPHDQSGMGVMPKVVGGENSSGMGGTTLLAWGPELGKTIAEPDVATVSEVVEEPREEALNIPSKHTDLKTLQRGSGGEPVDHKGLLREMQSIGVKQWKARQILNGHDHEVIGDVLDEIRERDDLKNPAGYLVRALEAQQDGSAAEKAIVSTVVSAAASDLIPIGSKSPGVEATRRERELFEAEKLRRSAESQNRLQKLLGRFKELDQRVREALKTYAATRHVENVVPNVTKKDELMRDERYQKIAFRETVERFFELFDGGKGEDGALAVVCSR